VCKFEKIVVMTKSWHLNSTFVLCISCCACTLSGVYENDVQCLLYSNVIYSFIEASVSDFEIQAYRKQCHFHLDTAAQLLFVPLYNHYYELLPDFSWPRC
jgi:hypothetical protein